MHFLKGRLKLGRFLFNKHKNFFCLLFFSLTVNCFAVEEKKGGTNHQASTQTHKQTSTQTHKQFTSSSTPKTSNQQASSKADEPKKEIRSKNGNENEKDGHSHAHKPTPFSPLNLSASKKGEKKSEEKAKEEDTKKDDQEKKVETNELAEAKAQYGILAPFAALAGDWGGLRSSLRKQGIEIASFFLTDTTWNIDGGRKQGIAFEYLFDLNLTARSEPLAGYPGGIFYVDFKAHHGQSPTTDYVGSFLFVDPIEAPPFNALYECWYKQLFGRNKSWFLIGKSDAYYNFTYIKHAALFFNEGAADVPTVFFFPTYPNSAMSVILSLHSDDGFSVTAGIFDGSAADGYFTGKAGVFGRFFDNLFDHAFIIGEADYEWTFRSNLVGRLGVGWWKHTATFPKFGGGTKKGTSGPYITLDQTVYKTDDEEIGVFFLYGKANPLVSPISDVVGMGVCWQGFFSCRPLDTIGTGFSLANFSHKGGSPFTQEYEGVYELFYHWIITPWLFAQPDFQYYIHPGGMGLPNATVFTLRVQLTF